MSDKSVDDRASVDEGARHFRNIARVSAAVFFLVLLVIAAQQYISCLRAHPAYDNIYNGIQQWATLTRWLFWLGVSAIALLASLSRKMMWFASYLCLLLLAETLVYLYDGAIHRHLYHPQPATYYDRFERHPFVYAILRPGHWQGLSHDAMHRRTTINLGKATHPKLIYVFGGSTAYDIGNIDANAWPSRLSEILGPDYEVENLAVPAFSSMESMAQSLFAFRDTAPTCALYYQGWNDLRESHIEGLSNDYSSYEYPFLLQSLSLDRVPSFLERNSILVAYAVSIFTTPLPRPKGVMSGDPDPLVSKLYKQNIRLISAIGQTFGVRVVFIPQILDLRGLDTGGMKPALPFIASKDMRKLMTALNNDMAEAAGQSEAYFLGTPLSESWDASDFDDYGHFNPKGALRFAQSIAGAVRKICR